MTTDEEQKRENIKLELSDELADIGESGEYVDLHADKSCLDGNFTADELRKIADKMDELSMRLAMEN